MRTSGATIGIGALVVVLATALPSRSQGPEAKEAAAKRAVIDRERLPTRLEHDLWRQKAEIELSLLEAQVEAKKAEIKRGDAEYRMGQLAPTFALFAKLDKSIALRFPRDTPLEDVLKSIKSATAGPEDGGLPIYVDPIGLHEAGKTLQSPVSIDIEDIPAKVALRLVLKQVGLAFEVNDGLVTITSPEAVELGAGGPR